MTDLKDWIEKLRDQKTATCPADYEERCELAHALSALEKERDALKALVGRMVEGLEPFAKVAEQLTQCTYGPAWGFNGAVIEHEDFRRARSLLSEAKGEGEKQGASRSQPCADAGAHIPRSPDTQHSDGGTE